ncbi:MAG: hypothetical protein U9O41_05760 [Candidatus Aerophobetes bacterium]|nr:hypothetical protein [Candidatus Aerophobetes bacterium]
MDVRKALDNSESTVITKYRCEDQQVLEIEEDSSRGNLGKTTSSAKHLDDGIDEETEHDHKNQGGNSLITHLRIRVLSLEVP